MKKEYIIPSLESVSNVSINVICDSPEPGESEKISIDDWTEITDGWDY